MPLTLSDFVVLALFFAALVLVVPKWRTRRGVMIALAPAVTLFLYGYALDLRGDRVAREAGFLNAGDKALAEREGYRDPAAWSAVRLTVVAAEEQRERQACIDDFNCWTNRYVDEAARICADAVERLALNSFEWQGSGALGRFPRAMIGPGGTVITYVGDAITFQNSFGAEIIHTYECDYDTERDRVVAVRAEAGRRS